MFDLNNTRIGVNLEKPAAPGATFPEEGIILVRVDNGGKEAVQPSAAAGGEQPVGILIKDATGVLTKVYMENFTVPATPGPYTGNLTKSNVVTTTLRAYDNTAAAPLTPVEGGSGDPGAGNVRVILVSGALTFNLAQQGHSVTFTYRYSPSATELASERPRQRSVNNTAQDYWETVSVGSGKCEVYTDQYDTTQAYAVNDQLTTGAAGRFTKGGGGTNFGRVIKVPAVGSPFLGVAYTV